MCVRFFQSASQLVCSVEKIRVIVVIMCVKFCRQFVDLCQKLIVYINQLCFRNNLCAYKLQHALCAYECKFVSINKSTATTGVKLLSL